MLPSTGALGMNSGIQGSLVPRTTTGDLSNSGGSGDWSHLTRDLASNRDPSTSAVSNKGLRRGGVDLDASSADLNNTLQSVDSEDGEIFELSSENPLAHEPLYEYDIEPTADEAPIHGGPETHETAEEANNTVMRCRLTSR